MKTYLVVLICLLTVKTQCKVQSCKSKLGKTGATQDYCTKFGVGEEHTLKASVSLSVNRTKWANPDKFDSGSVITIQAGIFDDQSWDAMQGWPQDEKAYCEKRRALAEEIIDVAVPVDGSWSKNASGKDNQDDMVDFSLVVSKDRPHMYYFMVLDCDRNTATYYGRNVPKVLSKWQVMTRESHDYNDIEWSHFSYEDQGQLSLTFWLWLFMSAVTVLMVKAFRKYYKTHDEWVSPHLFMIVALLLQVSSQSLELIHWNRYSSDGAGLLALDIIAVILRNIAEVTMSSLFLMLANGWTLTYDNIDWDANVDMYIPLGTVVGVVYLLIGAFDFLDVDASHKYHDYAGIQGYFMIAAKLLLMLFYVYQMTSTRKLMDKKLQKYFDFLFTIGSTYFVAVPASILSSYMFPPYSRQFVFLSLSQVLMFAATLALYYQLAAKESGYAKNTLQAMGLLPGGGL